MYLLANLEIVQKVMNLLRPDAIFRYGSDSYFITFCHGHECGSLTLSVNNASIYTSPANIREAIYDSTGFRIPSEARLLINPCYPKLIKRVWEAELREFNVRVLGDWDDPTGWDIFDVNGRTINWRIFQFQYVGRVNIVSTCGAFLTNQISLDERNYDKLEA